VAPSSGNALLVLGPYLMVKSCHKTHVDQMIHAKEKIPPKTFEDPAKNRRTLSPETKFC